VIFLNKFVDLENNYNLLTTALNDYSIVVQEYFHIKTEDFLNLIAKQVFLLDHFWGRFEFAKVRGQIHLHLLGVIQDAVTKVHDVPIAEQPQVLGQMVWTIYGMIGQGGP
jgi:hypothetical protein